MASQTVLRLKGPTLGRAAYLRTDPSLRLRFRGKLISNIYCFFYSEQILTVKIYLVRKLKGSVFLRILLHPFVKFVRCIVEHLHGKLKGSGVELSYIFVNPLSPNSDPHKISPNNNTACLNRQVMRMNEMITKDEML